MGVFSKVPVAQAVMGSVGQISKGQALEQGVPPNSKPKPECKPKLASKPKHRPKCTRKRKRERKPKSKPKPRFESKSKPMRLRLRLHTSKSHLITHWELTWSDAAGGRHEESILGREPCQAGANQCCGEASSPSPLALAL